MAYILVIDDEASVRTVLQRMLESAGHEVRVAAGGEEGLANAGLRMPDLVVTDLLMPGTSGIRVITELRERSPTLPILAISGGGAGGKMNFLATAKTFPRVQALQKPIDRAALLRAVDGLLAPA